MPSHFYLPAIPAALSEQSHILSSITGTDLLDLSQVVGKCKLSCCWLLTLSKSHSFSRTVPQRLLVTEANFWLQQWDNVDNVKCHVPGTHSTSGRLGYFLFLWRFFGELISEGWEKTRVTLLIFVETVSRALIGFKQSFLQHWEELWWKQLERWAAVWGSLLMGVGLTMQVRALLEGRRGN